MFDVTKVKAFVLILFTLLALIGCSSNATNKMIDVNIVNKEVTNQIPKADAGYHQVITVGNDAIFDAGASNDDGSIESYSWDENGTQLSSNVIFEKSDFKVGTHTITLTVTDNLGATSSDTVVVTVNEPDNLIPVAYPQSVQTKKFMDKTIILSGSDEDGDSLIFIIEKAPLHGTLKDEAPNLIYTPNGEYTGKDSFTFKVNDGIVDSIEASVSILIRDVSITHDGIRYGIVKSPYTQRIWLDRNLGASRACKTHDDRLCYGYYYQWGRGSDGHQKPDSKAVEFKENSNVKSAFIIGNSDWMTADTNGKSRVAKWSKTDGKSICPAGYRVPTITEIEQETIARGVTNNAEAFKNFLKLPAAGYRSYVDDSVHHQGSQSFLWSNTTVGSTSHYIYFNNSFSNISGNFRAYGFPVRCIKN